MLALLAAWLLAVPLVLAATGGLRHGRAPQTAARATALPACTLVGTAASETLVGTSGRDVICALGGDDLIRGRGGDDVLFGSTGDDTLEGGAGDDKIYGYFGADRLRGGSGRDFLQGGGDADVLRGGRGADTADYAERISPVRVSLGDGANDGAKGEGDDARASVENVHGGHADDTLIGDGDRNRLAGDGGDDSLKGRGGADRMNGGTGADRIDGRDGGGAVDVLRCGPGRPDAALADALDRVTSDCERVSQPKPPKKSNKPPTDILLDDQSVSEQQPAGTAVGMLDATDPDAGDKHTFELASGAGDADNGSFSIAGDQLRTRVTFDFESRSGYSVRLRVRDARGASFQKSFAITITDVEENRAPTGITLSPDTVAEGQAAGATVGTLAAADPDSGQTHGFALVDGTGDSGNGSFEIVGSTLKTKAVLDFETQASYSIRVRATDDGSPPLALAEQLTVTVTDAGEPPTADDKPATMTEDDDAKAIGLSGGDANGEPLTFSVVSGPQHGDLDTNTPAAACGAGTPSSCTASVDYTPDPDFNGSDSFSYTVNDGASDSAPATVSITVDPVNDAPSATSGSRSTDEERPLALDLGALVSDVETAGADLTYEIVSQPAHGTVTAMTYTPDADFNGPDSLTFKVTDRGDPDDCAAAPCDAPKTSSTETVSITVDPVNDIPDAASTSAGVDEDGSLPVGLDALVADVETADGDLAYSIITAPAHGILSGSAGSLTYTPDPEFSGADGFTYRVTDRGDPDGCAGAPCDAPATSSTETVSITVGAVNDAPVNFVPAGPLMAPPGSITAVAGISVTDVDAAGDDLQLGLEVAHGTLTVDTTALGGVGGLDLAGNGTAGVTITASLAQINTTLAGASGLLYEPDAGQSGADTLTITTDDLGHNGAGGGRTDTDVLAIAVVSPPVAASQSLTTGEDAAKTITLAATDADGDDPLGFAKGTGPGHGSLGTIGAVTCDHLTPNSCTADVVYTPDADYDGPDSFTFTAGDGIAESAAATVSITVDPLNDAPRLENTEAAALDYTENGAAAGVTSTTTATDADSSDFDTGTLTVDYAVGGTADDRLEIRNEGTGAGQIGISGSSVTFGGVTIGSFTGGSGTTPLVVTLNASATPAAAQALVRKVTYRNVSDSPSTAARTARFVLTDGDGGTSAPAARSITLTAADDPPVLAGIEAGVLAFTENDPATAVTAAITVTDPDSDITGATVRIDTGLAASEDVLEFAGQPGITYSYNAGTGVLTLTGSATAAVYQAALRAVTYRNTSDDPSTLTRTVDFQAGGASNTVSRDVTVTSVSDAPVADDETFSGADSAVGNTTLVVNDPTDGAPATPDPTDTAPVNDRPHKTIAGDILAGDSDADGPGPLTITPGTFASDDGGSVTVEADGDFTFEPAPATSCTDASDFFDYTVEDSGSPEQTDTGRVTIAISGCAWYVDNDDAQGNDGTSEKPFDTLAQAENASGPTHSIFVYDGNDTSGGYAAGINLKASQKLIGEAAALTIGSDTLHSADAANKPTISDSNADVVDLDDGNEVRGLNIDPQGTGGGIAGTAGDTGGGTIDDVGIIDGGTTGSQPGLELNGTTGSFDVSNLVVSNSATGVLLNNAGTVNFLPSGTIAITSAGAPGLSATGTSMGTSSFDAITVTGSAGGGVSMANTTGTTTFGDGTGTDLALTTTSGATPAFGLASAGTVTVPAGGTANVSATGGPAVDVTGTGGASLAFDDVDSTNSANDGINLDGLGAGTFAADANSSIAGAAGIAFDVNGGSGTVDYNGAITNGEGTTAEITGRTGGALSLDGPITDSGDSDAVQENAISLSGDTGGTTAITGSAKTLNTGEDHAVAMGSSDGHALTISGGSLDVDTTTGKGLEATTSGTLTVAGTANTIDTGSGRAVNISATDIGTAVTLQRVSSNGAPSGILLNGTGAGAFNVTGTGTAGSGGTIQNSVGTGVSLTSVPGGVSMSRATVVDSTDDGIGGSGVAGLSLDNVAVTSNGDADGDNGIDFAQLTGTSPLVSDNVSGNFDSNVVVSNASGTLNLNVTGGTYSGATGAHGDGISVEGTGNGSQNLNVQGPIAFAGNVGDHVRHRSDAANTTDSDLTVNNATMTSPPTSGDGTCAGAVHGGGIIVSHGGNSNTDVTLTNNNIQSSCFGAVAVGTTGSVADQQSAQVDATIQGNTIGTSGVAGSGSVQGNGIFVDSNGNGLVRTLITNNTIRQWTNRNGIALDIVDGDAEMNATIRGNTLTEPNSAFAGTTTRGMTIQLGTAQAGDSIDACLDIGSVSDNSLKNTLTDTGEVSGAQPDVRYLHEGPGSVVQLTGFSGTATQTDITSWFTSRNVFGPTPVVSGAFTNPAGASTSSVASCPQPAP